MVVVGAILFPVLAGLIPGVRTGATPVRSLWSGAADPICHPAGSPNLMVGIERTSPSRRSGWAEL